MTQREFDIVVCQHALAMSNNKMSDHKWWRGYSAIWCAIFIVGSLAGGLFGPASDAICLAVMAVSFFGRHWLIQREHKIAVALYAKRAKLGELKIEETPGDQAEVAESSTG